MSDAIKAQAAISALKEQLDMHEGRAEKGYVPLSRAMLLVDPEAIRTLIALVEASEKEPQIPEGWALYSADFSRNAGDISQPGWVMLRKTGRAYAEWLALDDDGKDAAVLYVSGKGRDFDMALRAAIDAAISSQGAKA